MKTKFSSSFLLSYLLCLMLLTCNSNTNISNPSIPLQQLDSIENLYNISSPKTKDLAVRLAAIEDYTRIALRLDIDSLVYNGYMRKTAILNSLHRYDEALDYSFNF